VEAHNGSHDPVRRQTHSLEDLHATVGRLRQIVCELLVENQSLRLALFTEEEIVGDSASATVQTKGVWDLGAPLQKLETPQIELAGKMNHSVGVHVGRKVDRHSVDNDRFL
jgi:regulator of replication initiation timing